jgi:hypothetical protein
MDYYHHQFHQAQPIHHQYGTDLCQDRDIHFQSPQDAGQFAMAANVWDDPYVRGTLLHAHRTETKPRLSKEEVEQLEAEFQHNNKPSSSVKKGIAEQMRVDVARINVRSLPLLTVVRRFWGHERG